MHLTNIEINQNRSFLTIFILNPIPYGGGARGATTDYPRQGLLTHIIWGQGREGVLKEGFKTPRRIFHRVVPYTKNTVLFLVLVRGKIFLYHLKGYL